MTHHDHPIPDPLRRLRVFLEAARSGAEITGGGYITLAAGDFDIMLGLLDRAEQEIQRREPCPPS
jgi:hypothetical protein